MKFICFSDWQQLPASAIKLFQQGARENMFYSQAWFENLSCHLEDDEELVIACVMDSEQVLAIFPLIKMPGQTWSSLKHRYTTHFSLLLANDNPQAILNCLAEGLKQLPFKGLLIEPVAGNDKQMHTFQQVLEEHNFHCDQYFRFYNWIHPVHESNFEQYMAARPSRLKNTITRKSRKLEREHGYVIHLYKGDEVPAVMPDYYQAYSASWKANEQFVSFMDGIVAGFSKHGWSRLAVLYVKNQPVAAQLWFVVDGKASIFRLAYDESWKPYSPGSILTAYLMEYVIDVDKVTEIDFLTGNEAYKQEWMTQRRERFALSCIKEQPATNWFQSLKQTITSIFNPRK